MMGTAYKQASSELIAEYILDKVRLNNNLRPKEIMNNNNISFMFVTFFLSISLNSHVLNNGYCRSFFQLGHGVGHLSIDILECAHICKPTTKKKKKGDVRYKVYSVST